VMSDRVGKEAMMEIADKVWVGELAFKTAP
jgi:hypothetical protein